MTLICESFVLQMKSGLTAMHHQLAVTLQLGMGLRAPSIYIHIYSVAYRPTQFAETIVFSFINSVLITLSLPQEREMKHRSAVVRAEADPGSQHGGRRKREGSAGCGASRETDQNN